MTYDPNTLAYLIGLQLSRFPGACDHWVVCDPRWPGMIAIRLEQLGQYYVPVDGERFLEGSAPRQTLPGSMSLTCWPKRENNSTREIHNNNGQ